MPVQLDPVSRKAFAGELAGLSAEFQGIFSAETIERYVSESIDRMQGARLTDFCRSSSTASLANGCAPWHSPRAW